MPNYNVFLEGAWLVKDVATGEDAIGIAISEAGKRLNPKLEYVGVDVGTMRCSECEENFMSVYVVADTALVGLLFQMKVYEAESKEHAARIATSVIGKALRDVPLKLVSVDEFQSESKSKPRESGSDFSRGSKHDEETPKRNFERGVKNEEGAPKRNFVRGAKHDEDAPKRNFVRGTKHDEDAPKRNFDRNIKENREPKRETSGRSGKKTIEYD